MHGGHAPEPEVRVCVLSSMPQDVCTHLLRDQGICSYKHAQKTCTRLAKRHVFHVYGHEYALAPVAHVLKCTLACSRLISWRMCWPNWATRPSAKTGAVLAPALPRKAVAGRGMAARAGAQGLCGSAAGARWAVLLSLCVCVRVCVHAAGCAGTDVHDCASSSETGAFVCVHAVGCAGTDVHDHASSSETRAS